jgi:hypothetical protein
MFSGSLSSQEKTERADDVLVRERVRKVRAFLVRLFEIGATVIAENWQQLRQPRVVYHPSSLLGRNRHLPDDRTRVERDRERSQ